MRSGFPVFVIVSTLRLLSGVSASTRVRNEETTLADSVSECLETSLFACITIVRPSRFCCLADERWTDKCFGVIGNSLPQPALAHRVGSNTCINLSRLLAHYSMTVKVCCIPSWFIPS